MAYLTQDDEEERQRVEGQGAGGGSFASGGGGSSPGTPQAGSGGTKQFANIQNYLKANEGQSSAPQFQKEVGGALESEQQGFDKSLSDYQGQLNQAASGAQSQLETGKSALQSAKDYYKVHDPLTFDYSAGSAFNKELQDKMQPLRSAYSASYSTPSYGGYGTSQKFNEYAAGLKAPESTQGYYEFLNKARGGNNMTPGQRALQNQLDVADTQLPEIRKQLADKYQAFQESVAPRTQEAMSQGSQKLTDIQKQQDDLRKQYEQFQQNRQGYEGALADKKYDIEGQTGTGAGNMSLKDLYQYWNGFRGAQTTPYIAATQSNFQNILNQLRGQYGI